MTNIRYGQDEDNDGIVGCDHCYDDYNRGRDEHTYDVGNNCDEDFLASWVGGKHDYIIIFIIYIIILPEEEKEDRDDDNFVKHQF